MEVKFDVKMTQKIMYNFLMNHTYRSMTGVMGILFGIAAFVIFGMTLGHAETFMSVLYLLFGIWFLLYLPINLYLRSAKQVKSNPVFQKPLHYTINDEGITTEQGDQQAQMKWEDLVKVTETKMSLLIYTGKRYSFVLPKEAMGSRYKDVAALIKKHMPDRKVKMK